MSTGARSVGDVVRMGRARSPDRVAVKERQGGRALTYAQLDDRTDRLAQALLGLGLSPGDRVGAWMEDCCEYVEVYLAVAKAGFVIVPINARYTESEAEHLLRDSGARCLIWTPGVDERVAGSAAAGGDLLLISTGPSACEGAAGYAELVAGAQPVPTRGPQEDDLYILGYTSGTTGSPKGAMLTHRSVLGIARINAISYRLPIRSVGALTGSMSFVATVPAHVITHLYLGGTCVLMGRWDLDGLMSAIEAERATFTYVPSPLIGEFTAVAGRDPRRWASLETILHSASKVDPDKLRALCEVVGDRFVEGLGMTENSGGLLTATTRADVRGESPAADVFSSVGRAAAECVIDVVDDDGRPVPRDGASVGEIVARSPALMSGYWQRPEATAAALRDGWYHSGDLGRMDPAGYLYLVDRRTDLIVSGGVNVYPSEVEACIFGVNGVAECVVVGLPHERWGRTIVAAVVREPASSLTEDDVVRACTVKLASYKKPTAVVFLDELPRTTSQKVKRHEVAEMLLTRL